MQLSRPASIPGFSIIMLRPIFAFLTSGTARHAQRSPRPAGKLRVGCIGAGGFARSVFFPYLRSSAELILESVATSSGATAESARKLFDFRIAEIAL